MLLHCRRQFSFIGFPRFFLLPVKMAQNQTRKEWLEKVTTLNYFSYNVLTHQGFKHLKRPCLLINEMLGASLLGAQLGIPDQSNF